MSNTITFDRTIRFIVGLAVIFLTGWLIYTYANLIAYILIALVLTYILDPIVSRIQAAGMNRTLAITLTLASVILVLVWISTSVFPIIVNQMVDLAKQLNIDNLQIIAGKIETRLSHSIPFLPEGYLEKNLVQITQDLFDIGRLPSALGNVIGVFTNIFAAFLVIPFATFFFLKDGSKIRRQFLRLVPNNYFESTLSLIDKIETRLGIYLRSVMLQSFLVAMFSWLNLSIAGLNNSLSVGIAAGVANAIPYFGPVMGYILSILVSIVETGDFTLVTACIIAILVVQIMDNVIFQPLIFSRSADMHPLAILFIILIGAETAGILGMLLAIPIATIIKITIEQINWCLNNYYVFKTRT